MRGKMIELNKDCLFNKEELQIKELEEKYKSLIIIYDSDCLLSEKISKTLSLYVKLFSSPHTTNLLLCNFRGDHTLMNLLDNLLA